MKLTVKFFASLREALGPQLALELPGGAASVTLARQALMARGEPFLSQLAPSRAVRAAVNQQLADDATPLQDGDELAFFPPVTGG
jgi:molybdopterin synthase sulfur carrier subunit